MRNTTNRPTDEDAYYHEEVTYDSKRENWSGLLSLLMIPLFIGLVGFGIASTFKLPTQNNAKSNEKNEFSIGIGGGPGSKVTPYKVPSITVSPPQLDDNIYIIQ